MRRDEVEAAWTWVEPILDALGEPSPERPKRYPAGTHRPHRRRHAPRARRPNLAGARPMSTQTIHPVVAEVTDRIVERSAATRAGVPRAASTPPPTRGPARGRLACANLAHGFAASEPSPTSRRCAAGRKPNVAIVSSLQRHALGAPALPRRTREALKKAVIRGRRHRAVRRRRARHVRRHHPGPRRHAALALQPRRDRDVDRDRALARHVRRRADARRLRQDRARPADRRAVLRPPARPSSCRPGR